MYYAYQKVNISIDFAQRKITTAYQLSNGVIWLPTEREPNGWYRGAVSLDGMFLSTGKKYRPVRDNQQKLFAFQDMEAHPDGQGTGIKA